jgi:hypothetical protein
LSDNVGSAMCKSGVVGNVGVAVGVALLSLSVAKSSFYMSIFGF